MSHQKRPLKVHESKPERIAISADKPLATLTEDDRDLLLGFDGQRDAAIVAAQKLAAQAVEQIGQRRAAYLVRLAGRHGIDPADLGVKWRIDLDNLAIERIES